MENDISFLILLILLSGVFSGSEVAFISLSKAKVQSLAERKHKTGKVIQKLKENPQKLLITILIGNNLVNIGASTLSAAIAIDLYGSQSLGILTAILTFVILLIGEIVPKTFAQKYSEELAKVFAYPLLFLEWILWPVIYVFESIINLLMKLGGETKIQSVTEEELLAMVNIGKSEGTFEAHEQQFISNILEFSDTQVNEVMTPRVKMKTLDYETSIEDAIKHLSQHPHTRIPIYKDDIDNIIGVLTIKNALKLFNTEHKSTPIKEAELLEAIFVPETKAIKGLFNDFKKKRLHMALVVDELGGVVGLLTLEDILEEIVGEIEDETDIKQTLIKKVANDTWLVEGHTELDEVAESLGLHFDDDAPLHKPVSFLILEALGRFPREGEQVELPQMTLIVEKMGKKRIEQVKVIKNKSV